MSISYQTGRRALWVFFTIGVVATLALILGLVHPCAGVLGRWGGRLADGNAEIAHGSHTLDRGLNCWTLSASGSFGGLVLGSSSRWLPNHQNGILSLGSGPGSLVHTLDSYFVPLPPIAIGSLLVALFFKRQFPKRIQPGLCKACGYDLAGIGADAPCPECGGKFTRR